MPSHQWLLKRADYYQQLADTYQKKADGLRFAAEESNGHRTTAKQATSDDVIEQARALRRQQKQRLKPSRKAKRGKGAFRDAALAVLHQAKAPLSRADFKSRIEERLGQRIRTQGLGSLARYGYVKLTADGYVVGTTKRAEAAE